MPATASTTTTSDKPTLTLSLHDCLSLGEVEQTNGTAIEEIQRLPLFLRVLSLTRPLASISILEQQQDDDDDADADESNKARSGDPLVNRAVERLEHVAATHSVAEGVDVVTCHLAPSMSRKLSLVAPLTRSSKIDHHHHHHHGEWDTAALAAVARNPRTSSRSSGSKRKKSMLAGDDNEEQVVSTPEQKKGIDGSSDEEEEQEEEPEEKEHQALSDGLPPKKKRRRDAPRRDSMEVAAEDSQEATVVKTLSELATLVVTFLRANLGSST